MGHDKLWVKVYDAKWRYKTMMPVAEIACRIVDEAEQKRDRAQMENAALRKCCESAALEILQFCCGEPHEVRMSEVAAIIYKHIRNGREL